MTPPFLLQLHPDRLEAVLDVEVLKAALGNLTPGATHVSFSQPLPADAAQALVLSLLALPSVGGPLAGDLLADILQQQALAVAKPTGMTH